MIDTVELVAAIKRVREKDPSARLHLLVPRPLGLDMETALAQIDVKMVAWPALTPNRCFLLNADKRHYWDLPPEPMPSFKAVLPDWWGR